MVKTSTAKAAKTGRPEGTKNPTAKQAIARRLNGIYRALIAKAESGDAAAAALCFDITKNPQNYPDPESPN